MLFRSISFEAGYPVVLATPVITFIEDENDIINKRFSISVDNSKVVSSPIAPIYYTLPNGELTLYTEPISIEPTTIGWLSAICALDGYETSVPVRRYIDNRETYTESYVVLDNNVASLPVETGDFEIDYESGLNAEITQSLKTSGRIYMHRKAENGYINLVLPFAMLKANFENGTVYVTDANGKKLEKGIDFTIYKIEGDENPVGEIYEGNIVANNNGYYVKVSDNLIDKELIFVSAPGVTISVTNPTYKQPSTGYSSKTNSKFKTLRSEERRVGKEC